MQALIKGSGLFSRGSNNDTRQTHHAKEFGSTGPASMYGSASPNPDLKQASKPAILPERTEQVSFEHTLRGRSPVEKLRPAENGPEDAAALEPAPVSQPAVPRRLLKSESSMLHNSDIQQAQQMFIETHSASSHHVMEKCPSEEVLLREQAWQTLAALSDSYDRSAGNAQLGPKYTLCLYIAGACCGKCCFSQDMTSLSQTCLRLLCDHKWCNMP